MNVSASSVKELTQCSLSFYYNRVLKMPQKVWPRTVIGSLCHAIFESLANPRHHHHYKAITAPGDRVNYRLSPVVVKLVCRWQERHQISDELLADLNGMLYVGLLLIDFYITDAVKVYPPEHEFSLDLGDGVAVRGFIDQLADMGEYMLIRDYKSQRNRFTAKEMGDSIQSYVYQLYAWEKFKKPARVEFVMLRHPPTKRTPDKHLQVVEPSTPPQLEGLKGYLRDVGRQTEGFGLEDALRHPNPDAGFCQNVCSYLRPFDYWALVPRTNPTILTPIKTYPLDKPPQDGYDREAQMVVKRSHLGCLARYPQPEPQL